jgi:hypothetical protein
LALPTLLHGCETLAIRERNKSRMMYVETKFMNRMAKYTWHHHYLYISNEDVLSELKTNPVVKIQNYINEWV